MRYANFALIVLLSLSGHSAAAHADPQADARAVFDAAVANPSDDPAFETFLKSLPSSKSVFTGETLYWLEGDLARTRAQVRAYLRARKAEAAGVSREQERNGELKLSMRNGEPMCWASSESRALRYAVMKSSFDELGDGGLAYRKTIEVMAQATGDWEAVCPGCGLKFTYVPTLDNEPADRLLEAVMLDEIRFLVVYRRNDDPSILASAFFPGDAAERRIVEIAQAGIELVKATPVTGKLSARGLLRHELGHALGYRHEHMDLPNFNHCRREGGQAANITPLDGISVMFYDCGRPGKPFGVDDIISPQDEVGHRKVYGPQAPSFMCGVRISGN